MSLNSCKKISENAAYTNRNLIRFVYGYILIILLFFEACSDNALYNDDSVENESNVCFESNLDDVVENSSAQEDSANNLNVKDKYSSFYDSAYPYADIPRVVINTENNREIKDKDTEIPAQMQIWGKDSPSTSIMNLTIRGRGNTSWKNMPQKSYKLEFCEKQALLDFPANRDWALISSYADKTLMKNLIVYNLASKIGSTYAPRCNPVELYLNGEYLGVYLLTETIKVDRNRINIPQNDSSFLVEFDEKYQEDDIYFISSLDKPYTIHYPKNSSSIKLLENHINDFESYLKTITWNQQNNLDEWISIDAFVKHFWLQEFSKNPDSGFYTSVYFTWVIGGKIEMGPVWDFDLAFGGHINEIANTSTDWRTIGRYWNIYLYRDTLLTSETKRFWNENKDIFLSVLDDISVYELNLQKASKNHFKRWDILSDDSLFPHAYDSYGAAVDDLKEWIKQRFEWIDSQKDFWINK